MQVGMLDESKDDRLVLQLGLLDDTHTLYTFLKAVDQG